MSNEDNPLGHHARRDFYPIATNNEHGSSIPQSLSEEHGLTVLSSYDQHREDSSTGSLYTLCENEFTNLVEELCKSHTNTQLDPDSALDQFDRLKLWAGNLGAKHAALSPISLDWRLRNAPDMKAAVIKLLDELKAATKSLIAIVNGARSDRVTTMRSDHNDAAIESNLTESSELFETICDSITGLFHLSLIIQRATPRDRFTRAVSTMKDTLDPINDIRHVADKFPKLDSSKHEWLRKKLGLTNTQRRVFFRYCRDHHESKAAPVEQPSDNKTITQTVASTLDPNLLGQAHTQAFSTHDDDLSQTSFATSVNTMNNDDILHVPRLDTVSKVREAFQCPYCYMIINPQSHRFWKDRLRAHLEQEHAKTCPPSMISSLIMATVNMPDTFSVDSCPFCDELSGEVTKVIPSFQNMQRKDISAKKFRKHVAGHMEQLAFFALPRLYNDDDATQDNGSKDNELSDSDSLQNSNDNQEALPILEHSLGLDNVEDGLKASLVAGQDSLAQDNDHHQRLIEPEPDFRLIEPKSKSKKPDTGYTIFYESDSGSTISIPGSHDT